MRALRWLPLLCLALLLAGCSSKPKDLIVGKWEGTEGETKDATVEFTKDGKVNTAVKLGGQEIKIEGTYKWVDDENIELELKAMGQSHTEKNKVKVTKDELELTDPKGKVAKFKRAK